MKQYLEMVKHIRDNGTIRNGRTGVKTLAVFGYQNRYNLADGFPLLTTKYVNEDAIVRELLWFISGSTNQHVLLEAGINIWKSWADDDGNLGPIYGKQWRSWDCPDGSTIDQIQATIHGLNTRPASNRHIVTGWNPADLPDETISPQENVRNGKAALPPCHTLFQFDCEPISAIERLTLLTGANEPSDALTAAIKTHDDDKVHLTLDKMGVPRYKLHCQLYQRSADVFLGVPYNIASYALMTMMIAQVCNMVPGEFVHSFGNLHIYENHMDQVAEQLSRPLTALPTMKLNKDVKHILDFTRDDFELLAYDYLPPIYGKVAV